MCNAVFKYVTGNVIWQIDVDEFYHDWVHEYINNYLMRMISWIKYPFVQENFMSHILKLKVHMKL